MKNDSVVTAKTAQHGFTLTELLLSVAIIFIVAAFSFPLGVSFYKTQILHDTRDSLTSTLRKAYIQAVSGMNDSAYGVKIQTDQFTLFQGTTYDARIESEDELFPISSSVTPTGLTEVVFAQMSGVPSVTGVIVLSISEDDETIEIGEHGLIEK